MSKKNQNTDKKADEQPKKNPPQMNPALAKEAAPQGAEQPADQAQGAPPQERDKERSKGPRKPVGKKKETGPSEFVEQVVSINRITKVTKGGKKLSFSALVVVGDTKGKVGYSLAKANEVATAIKKSLISAKKNMIKVPMSGSTITHHVIGVCGGAEVLLKPAADGTGVIAAGPVRAICDAAGIRNILTKCHRSNNPINVVKAVIDGFSKLKPRIASSDQPANISAEPVSAAPGVKENVSA